MFFSLLKKVDLLLFLILVPEQGAMTSWPITNEKVKFCKLCMSGIYHILTSPQTLVLHAVQYSIHKPRVLLDFLLMFPKLENLTRKSNIFLFLLLFFFKQLNTFTILTVKVCSQEDFKSIYSKTRKTEKSYCPFQCTVNVRALVLDCIDSGLTMWLLLTTGMWKNDSCFSLDPQWETR